LHHHFVVISSSIKPIKNARQQFTGGYDKESIMVSTASTRRLPWFFFTIFLFFYCHMLLAAPPVTIAAGLNAVIGTALDEIQNQLYFVEYNPSGNGSLKRIDVPPRCNTTTTPACDTTIISIADGFHHPEDVALDLASMTAYITTRDDPGTTGALWRVDITSSTKSLVTFNLGAPQQLVLDLNNNRAYTVGYNDGRLHRIDLSTGSKVAMIIGLDSPVGLALSSNLLYAYVTEQGAPARVSEVDLTAGIITRNIVSDGSGGVSLVNPFFLEWTDKTQNSLYVVERDPADKVARIDINTSAINDVVTGLPWRSSSSVANSVGTRMFIASDSDISIFDLFSLDGPVFMGVGHVPWSSIDTDGYATTDPGYFYRVKDSPFGGTMNFFGNISSFKNDFGATHYAVLVSKDGGPFVALNRSWNTYKWNSSTNKYELEPVAPSDTVVGVNPDPTPVYQIPLESDGTYHPEFWYPPYKFMRWKSGDNGNYTFTVQIFEQIGSGWTDLTPGIPPALNTITLKVDNTPPKAKLLSIWQNASPDKEIMACDIISTGNNQYYFYIDAYDANGHLRYYRLRALWGNNESESIDYHNYVGDPTHPAPLGHIDEDGVHLWDGVTNQRVPATGYWVADCNCAHTFYLHAGKRTINGYDYILHRGYHKSITINNTGMACP
jgi:hypothetical protein